MDTILNNDNAKVNISERTAQRWLAKLGWAYGRDKGYYDGHESDVVFCPHLKIYYHRTQT